MIKRLGASALAALLLLQSSFAATISFDPTGGELIAQCPTQIDVILDTEEQETTTLDLSIVYDSDQYEFNDFVYQGAMFRSYTLPRIVTIDEGPYVGQKAVHILASTLSRQGINREGLVGTITITPQMMQGTLDLEFNYVPNTDTDDTNVAIVSDDGNSVSDVLRAVTNASYTIITGECINTIKTNEGTEVDAATIRDQKLSLDTTENTSVEFTTNEEYEPQFANEERADQVRHRYYTLPPVIGSLNALDLGILAVAAVIVTTLLMKIFRRK